MDNVRGVQYDFAVDYALFFVLVGAVLCALAGIWLLPGHRPKYLLTIGTFAGAAAILWIVFDSGRWASIALGLAAFALIAKIHALRSHRRSAG